MSQIKPNSAIVEAEVTGIQAYSRQADFSVLLLHIKSASPKADETFLLDREKDSSIKALISNEAYKSAHIKDNTIIMVEVKKVSVDLWRITRFISGKK